MNPVAILEAGMVTPVGLSAAASCAAMRGGIAAFGETRFLFDGELLVGCQVPFEDAWRGREKLVHMVIPAIQECLAGREDAQASDIVLLLCIAEQDRMGMFQGADEGLLRDVEVAVGATFHSDSRLIPGGRVGGVRAVADARELLSRGHRFCIVAGVDTYLVGPTLSALHAKHRLKTSENSDGFIPGEAGAAVLLGAAGTQRGGGLDCVGIGFGAEPAPLDSGEPLRADGLVDAFKATIRDAGASWEDIDYRIADLSGEQYGFKQAALALTRTMRTRKEEFDIWHPADCIGEVGAAAVPCILGVALHALRKGYGPGPGVLCHFANDDGERAAMLLRGSAA